MLRSIFENWLLFSFAYWTTKYWWNSRQPYNYKFIPLKNHKTWELWYSSFQCHVVLRRIGNLNCHQTKDMPEVHKQNWAHQFFRLLSLMVRIMSQGLSLIKSLMMTAISEAVFWQYLLSLEVLSSTNYFDNPSFSSILFECMGAFDSKQIVFLKWPSWGLHPLLGVRRWTSQFDGNTSLESETMWPILFLFKSFIQLPSKRNKIK